MKLIVTIPAYNEESTIADVIREIPRHIPGIDIVNVLVLDDGSADRTVHVSKSTGADFVFSHKKNKGLAETFSDAMSHAVMQGADIIVNTDADNHYDQSRIPDLIQPILDSQADIVIGSRILSDLKDMPAANKYGNRIGSFFVRKLFGLGDIDVSTGFRAYSKEAAMKMQVLSKHTYTHETLIQAKDMGLIIANVPIKARLVKRKSRLIKGVPSHIVKSLAVILRSFTLYKPLRVFSMLGTILFIPGLLLILRFFYFYITNGGQGHVQSLIVAAVLMLIGFQIFIMGLVASAIGWNRKMIEKIMYHMKRNEIVKKKIQD